MKHYDEKIIELYFLGSSDVDKIKDDIENHLAECYGCNEIYLQIKEFYPAVDGSNNISEHKIAPLSSKALSIKPVFGNSKIAGSFLPKTLIGKTYFLLRTNPVKSGLSLVAAIAFFLFGLNYNKIIKDDNPVFLITNDSLKVLQVYNQSNEKLFELPFTLFGSGEHEISYNVKLSYIDDLAHEGKKQIISIVPGLLNSGLYNDTIKVLNYQGKLLKKAKIGRSVLYNGKELSDKFNAFALIIDDFDNDGEKEIYIGVQSYNSPYVLVKMDKSLNVIGEYWHHGHFWGMNKVSIGNKTGILLCGLNDLNTEKVYPIISFIEPDKLNGIRQSSETPVFGNFSILKETYYLKFPILSISDTIKHKPRINYLVSADGKEIKINYGLSSLSKRELFGDLVVSLNHNLEIIDISPTDNFKRIWGMSYNNQFKDLFKY